MGGVLDTEEDAFGAALLGELAGGATETLMLEDGDGTSRPAMHPREFFGMPSDWLWWERDLLEDLEGPVLDLGCGAGRHSLYLQERGLSVTAVDISPGAVEVCRSRGIHDVRLADLTEPPTDQQWGAVLMMCGNLGLAGSWDATRDLLARLARCCRSDATLAGDTVAPGAAADAVFRLRLRYGTRLTPWWDLLCIPPARVEALVDGTGWAIEQHVEDGSDHAVRLRRV